LTINPGRCTMPSCPKLREVHNMYAQINIPGSSHFQCFGPASKQECRNWLDKTVSELLETELLTSTLPRLIISNKLAEKQKYLDGSRVFGYPDHWRI
jgi:hypothetical protein